MPIVVSLAPMGEKTNLKPAPKQEVKPKPKSEAKKPEPKPPEPKKPEPKKPEPKPPEPKKEEPKKETPKLPDPKKPEPKKEEKKPEKKKDELDEMLDNLDKKEKKKTEPKKDNSELNDLLKDLDAKTPEAKSSDAKENTNPDSKSDLPFDPNSPEALDAKTFITKLIVDQIKVCWNPPAGGRDAQNLNVRVNVDIAQDGTMKFVGFEGAGSGGVYQAMADSTRRAIQDPMCNPLKTVPPIDKYYIWKEMTLRFSMQDI